MVTINENLKTSIVLFLALILSQVTIAQFSPYFQNYSSTQFNGGNQNWDISYADNGKVYVANDKGLLEFDGMKWGFHQLPNKTTIRSVLAKDSLIYTGSYEEFGYWKKSKKGELLYTSLSHYDEDITSKDEEFWQILNINDTIFFRSFSNLYILDNKEIIKIKPQSSIISCNVINDELYIATLRHGVFVLRNQNLVALRNTNQLANKRIVAVTQLHDSFLISTALDGCFLYKRGKLKPWNTKINELVKNHQLNRVLKLRNDRMVFGTIKNGVYITDLLGNVLFDIDNEDGLQNSTVLSLCDADYNKLWVGLDNGVTLIDLNNNHLFYTDNSGDLGAVYDVISYNDEIYVCSNTGLFYLNKKDNKLKFIANSQGQIWDLKIVHGQLFCGHNDGTYVVDNYKLKKISNYTGGWVIEKVPESPNIYIQGSYAGLIKYEYFNGEWKVTHVQGTTIPVKYMVFEDNNTAWVAHAYKGVFRVTFNADYSKIIDIKDYAEKGLASNYNVKLYNLKNDICFKTNDGWQMYVPLLDSIVPNNLLNKTLGKDTYIISETNTELLATKNKNDDITFLSIEGGTTKLNIASKLYQKRLVVDEERVSQINDSIYALNLYNGFMLINQTNKKENDSLKTPVIEKINVNGELLDITKEDYELPFNKAISVSVSSPNYNNTHYFEYALSSDSKDLHWIRLDNEKLELSRLSNGNYKIHFRAGNISGDVSQEKVLSFTILPPWYKDGLFYLVLLIFVFVISYILHKKKIEKEQNILHQKFIKEQEALLKEKAIENEKKLVQVKNKSLKNEVTLKSKQLANTAMALVKKNESLLDIKSDIVKNKSSFQSAMVYRKLIKRIDDSIGHEDEWELFEYNFNQVHEEFFKQLKSQFPKLTHKDLKICAYIKMNLLSKEIAPLMNISIRGLETHRYRLKKKLDLENDQSLGDFLRNFK
ncbi:helix-turn-helix and ligand-binding sensor domain-containing protein [Gaetbulibacter saemankumensis]|uniref:helix-turn-helix and ligand-binding sensor domain-containing protein n=1 Tax=Gaetbulibacter saemankumensis TaxID=311208 RepID=UPI00041BF726|nr:transcriptional regulator [Gaetbulibacter saemankumensis]